MKKTKLLLITVFVLLCGCLLFCGCEKVPVDPGPDDNPDDNPGVGMPDDPDNPGIDEKEELYTFEFTSRGHGTCDITKIIFSEKCTEDFTLVIPEKSPGGDVVVGVIDWLAFPKESNTYKNLPMLLTEKSFNDMLAKVQSNGMPDYSLSRLNAFYIRLDLSAIGGDETVKEKALKQFPLAEQLPPLYWLDVHSTIDERTYLSEILAEYDYTDEDKFRAYEDLFALIKEQLSEEEYYFSDWCIYPRAFAHLIAVEFPESLLRYSPDHENPIRRYMDLGLFAGCEKLTTLTNYTTGEKFVLEDRVMYNVDKTFLAGVFKYYHPLRDAQTGEYVPSKFVIPDTVVEIGYYALQGCAFLDEVEIPYGVQKLKNDAFADCHSLTDVKLPASVTEIHPGVFSYCTGLVSIDIPDSVTLLAGATFEKCASLVKVVLPSGIQYVGPSMFACCTRLQEVVIPEGVTQISAMAFMGCHSLNELFIPKNVSKIDPIALVDIAKIKIDPENPYYRIQGDCLIHIETQTAVLVDGPNIPSGVKHIEGIRETHYSFHIPHGVASLEYVPDCTELYLPSTLVEIGSINLNSCPNLETITFLGTEAEWNAITKGKGWEEAEGKYTLVFKDVAEYYLELAREKQSSEPVREEISKLSKIVQNEIKSCNNRKKMYENALAQPGTSENEVKRLRRDLTNRLAILRRCFLNGCRPAMTLHEEYEFFTLALQVLDAQAGASDVAAAKQEIAGYKDAAAETLEFCGQQLSEMYEQVMETMRDCHSDDVDTGEQQQLVQEAYDEWLACVR